MQRFLFFFMLVSLNGFSQSDTLYLSQTEIHSSRIPVVYNELSRTISIINKEELASLPVVSLDDILNYVLNVDVRSRGAMGVQSDISMRSGTFEQYVILLNGVKMNDPQTGHHNLNLPLDISNITHIEVLHGPGARIYDANAFTGAVNIITAIPENHGIQLKAEAGDYGFKAFNTKYFNNKKLFSHQLSFGHKSSSGYRTNTDFADMHLFWYAEHNKNNKKFIFQTGLNNKAFGANGFYSPLYPHQFENIRSSFSNIRFEKKGRINYSSQLFYRLHQDRFELFREGIGWYERSNGYFVNELADTAKFMSNSYYKGHNYHLSHTLGADNNLWFRWKAGKTALGMDYKRDIIFSNVLGALKDDTLKVFLESHGLFTHTANRHTFSLFADHTLSINKLNISAGAMLFYNTIYKPVVFPGIDLSYYLSNSHTIIASAAKTLRVPTYTELYYKSPVHISNPALLPEEAISGEIGYRYINRFFQIGNTFYYRDSKNSIDWVRLKDSLKWESANITRIQSLGNEFYFKFNPHKEKNPLKYISGNFAYNFSQKSSDIYISQYALDYLKLKGTLILNVKVYGPLHLTTTLVHQKREGSFIDFSSGKEVLYKSFTTIDARLICNLKNLQLFAEASNITNEAYFDIGNLPMPGRWFKGGIVYSPVFSKD